MPWRQATLPDPLILHPEQQAKGVRLAGRCRARRGRFSKRGEHRLVEGGISGAGAQARIGDLAGGGHIEDDLGDEANASQLRGLCPCGIDPRAEARFVIIQRGKLLRRKLRAGIIGRGISRDDKLRHLDLRHRDSGARRRWTWRRIVDRILP